MPLFCGEYRRCILLFFEQTDRISYTFDRYGSFCSVSQKKSLLLLLWILMSACPLNAAVLPPCGLSGLLQRPNICPWWNLMYIFFSPSCYFFHFNKLHCCCCFFTYSSFPYAILHTNHWTTVPLILLNPFFGEICVIKKASELLQTIPFLNFIIYHFYLNNFTDNFN